jgi:Holliday junction resolvase RusA-like endonuclease
MKLTIQGELTDLNTYVNKERANRFAAAAIKEKETNRVYWECKSQKLGKVIPPVVLEFKWFTKDLRKDADNIAFGKKFILDGLVKAGVLLDDKRDMVTGFIDSFFVDKENPRVEVYMYEKKVLEKKEERQIPGSTRRGS